MKTLLTLFSVFVLVTGCCQDKNTGTRRETEVSLVADSSPGTCGCVNDSIEFYSSSCDTTFFSNGSRIYTQVTCDSSWVTFESKKGISKVIYSLGKDLIELTGSLGYQSFHPDEYENTFLIENILVSGSEEISGYVLLDKTTGDVIKDFGMVIFEGTDYADSNKMKGFVAYFKDESYNSVIFYNLNNGHTEEVQLKKDAVKKAFSRYTTHADYPIAHPLSQTTFQGNLVTILFQDAEGRDIGQKIIFNYTEFLQGRSGKANKNQ